MNYYNFRFHSDRIHIIEGEIRLKLVFFLGTALWKQQTWHCGNPDNTNSDYPVSRLSGLSEITSQTQWNLWLYLVWTGQWRIRKGGGGGNPDPEIWQVGGGAWSQKQFFSAPQAGGTPLDLPRRVKVDWALDRTFERSFGIAVMGFH